jgi:hypothetical protein
MAIDCVGHAATIELSLAQKQIQQMAREQTTTLTDAQVTQLKGVLRQSELLNSARLERATINALGKLVPLASADREFLDPTVRGNILDRLSQRIGIDVDARGYVSLADRVNVSLGREPVYGSIGRRSDSPLTEEQVRRINLARRMQGLTRTNGDNSNSAPFPGEPPPLAMRRPVYPTLPNVRAELLELMKLDQDARQPLTPGANGAERQAAINHVTDVDTQVHTRFLAIFRKYGFPTNKMVGHYGTLAAWVLVQHAIDAPDLMRDAAKQAKVLHDRGELPDGPYALLVDRVACLIEHSPQTYGTIPTYSDPKDPSYCPIEPPATEVNDRRAALFMEPIDIGPSKKY